jgi:hypothetical protein
MPPYHPKHPPPPQPTRILFDPFNSSSTGHQRDANRLSGSTSWRDSRSYKLSHQFKDTSGRGGNQHLSDLVGAGSKDFGKDGRKENGDWEKDAPGLREQGWQDIRRLMSGGRKRSRDGSIVGERVEKRPKSSDGGEMTRGRTLETSMSDPTPLSVRTKTPNDDDDDDEPPPSYQAQQTSPDIADDQPQLLSEDKPPPQIFRGLCMYLNGSTMPAISDHKLKHLFAQHGGSTSIALGRRTVTHVILGDTSSGGGGLSGRKIQKEVSLVRGKSVKYVSVQWVLDSIKRGVRQSEGGYVPNGVEGRLGGWGQGSVRGWVDVREKT